MVSYQEIARGVETLLRQSNPNAVTSLNGVMQQLEVELGLDLSHKMQWFHYFFILVCLFALQHYGTHRICFCFAPIVFTRLLCISVLDLYNIFHWNPHVYQALSPYYMIKFLKKTRKGSKAMFADLGHLSHAAIQIDFTFLVIQP